MTTTTHAESREAVAVGSFDEVSLHYANLCIIDTLITLTPRDTTTTIRRRHITFEAADTTRQQSTETVTEHASDTTAIEAATVPIEKPQKKKVMVSLRFAVGLSFFLLILTAFVIVFVKIKFGKKIFFL